MYALTYELCINELMPFLDTVKQIIPQAALDIYKLNHIIRKNTHFIAYLVLGILVINALKRSGVDGIRSVVPALLICVLYAASDEIHQLFVPGRGGQFVDVIIDSAGAIVGIGAYLLVGRVVMRRKIHPYRKIEYETVITILHIIKGRLRNA
jgi:VanZ family protein